MKSDMKVRMICSVKATPIWTRRHRKMARKKDRMSSVSSTTQINEEWRGRKRECHRSHLQHRSMRNSEEESENVIGLIYNADQR